MGRDLIPLRNFIGVNKVAATRPNVIYKYYLRRVEELQNKNNEDSKIRKRKFDLESKIYDAYAKGQLTKEQCDGLFDLIEV